MTFKRFVLLFPPWPRSVEMGAAFRVRPAGLESFFVPEDPPNYISGMWLSKQCVISSLNRVAHPTRPGSRSD